MRLLWFTNTPSLYKSYGEYNGGGWISSLEKLVRKNTDIELAIAFSHTDNVFKTSQDKTIYYPIHKPTTLISKITNFIQYSKQERKEVENYLRVIDDFKPDIIHIFGTERSFGLIAGEVNIPVIIHIQGLLEPCVNAWFPPGYSKKDFYFSNGFNPIRIYMDCWAYNINKYMAKREVRMLKSCKYFMGRTDWDKRITKLYAPNSKYFYCSEMLRDVFYTTPKRSSNKQTKIIVTTISAPLYKGADMLLKTAKLLKEETDIDFEWRVYGMRSLAKMEHQLKIQAPKCNIKLLGIASAEELANSLSEADLFFHPSYIDNSPNSVCEAQLIGLPVIACHVGGVASIVKQGENGFLVPANDPYIAVSRIEEVLKNNTLAEELGRKAKETATQRHNPDRILSDLMNIYNQLYAIHPNQTI